MTRASAVAAVFPATSRPVIVTPWLTVDPAGQLNRPETNGPPAGVDTVVGVWVRPGPPLSGPLALEAGPEPASVSALESVKEPAAAPRKKSVLPALKAPPETTASVRTFTGAVESEATGALRGLSAPVQLVANVGVTE
ncbi:hypothetical protein [Pengzhenrongella phosphoraccumulans]|uniref:hypothetical protein n=1 Tax=Pengzhenrongella phosphoraccumulans TaxID=3114394 RepID=UPI00388F0875